MCTAYSKLRAWIAVKADAIDSGEQVLTKPWVYLIDTLILLAGAVGWMLDSLSPVDLSWASFLYLGIIVVVAMWNILFQMPWFKSIRLLDRSIWLLLMAVPILCASGFLSGRMIPFGLSHKQAILELETQSKEFLMLEQRDIGGKDPGERQLYYDKLCQRTTAILKDEFSEASVHEFNNANDKSIGIIEHGFLTEPIDRMSVAKSKWIQSFIVGTEAEH